MFQLIGLKSGKVYAEGKHLSDCFRQLTLDYPTKKYEKGKEGRARGRSKKRIYPETLLIGKINK